MTHTATSARDGVLGAISVAWLASGTTSPIGLLWDDTHRTEEDLEDELAAARFDAQGNPIAYARAVYRTLGSGQEILGGPGVAKYQTEALLRVQIFTPPGDGNALADLIVEVLKAATRGQSVGSLYFFDVFAREVGMDKQWMRNDFQASARYEEK